jgi:heptosyltransferase I
MRILIIKMSSMGDIIHTLPAIQDAANALPGIQFDWVVEEAFIEIPRWHANVKQIIPIALRRWRKQPWQALQHGELSRFYKQLRLQHYDKVIDAQGSIKSAITTYLSRGYRLGLDKNSVRERFADLAYQEKFSISWKLHAIDRLRRLFSKALNFSPTESPIDYGIDKQIFQSIKFDLANAYLVIVPNASWIKKCWPEASWSLLLEKIAQTGLPVFIPWGNAAEKERAQRIRGQLANVHLLPKLNLTEIAQILSQAKAAVCLDTGLSHLAAAVGTPTLTLYGPTNPRLIGTQGASQIHLQSSSPTLDIPVETVWQALQQLLFVILPRSHANL